MGSKLILTLGKLLSILKIGVIKMIDKILELIGDDELTKKFQEMEPLPVYSDVVSDGGDNE
jgi:hypothetical protein